MLGLVECKARLFDVAEGYRQSGERVKYGKQYLLINNNNIINNKLLVDENVPCFVITTLP